MQATNFNEKDPKEDAALQSAIERVKQAASTATSLGNLAYILGLEVGILYQEKQRKTVTELSN